MPSQLLKPSPELAVITGDTPLSWVKICELVVGYIQENELETHPYIATDATLRAIVGDLEQVSVSEGDNGPEKPHNPNGKESLMPNEVDLPARQ